MKRRRADEHLVADDAERVEIGAMIGARIARGLLGRHVRRRADRRADERDRAACASSSSGRFPSRDAEIAFATPKSVTVADPPESRMLSGLMSRWMMPRPCA